MLTLRPAASDDLAALLALDAACFAPSERWNADSWTAEVGQPGRWLQVIEHQGQLIGAVSILLGPDLAELLKVLVAPDHRGRGLGRQLLRAGLDRASDQGLARLLLEVRHDNLEALTLYRAEGFTVIHTRPDYYGAGAHALVMERALPAGAAAELGN